MTSFQTKRCAFCNQPATMTREHIWGEWIKAFVPPAANKHGYQRIAVPRPGERVPEQPQIRAGNPVGATVPVVCTPCNSGWMSRLQERAKPYLIPLFDGQDVRLSADAQTAIAQWATMATMTAEYLGRDARSVAVSPEDRALLMAGTIPKGWRIWIGLLARPGWRRQWQHAVLPILDAERLPENVTEDERRPNTQTTTFTVGRLLVTVISCPFPSITRGWDWRTAPRARGALRQIWPIDQAPLGLSLQRLSHVGANMIADAFVRYSDRIALEKGYR